MHATTFIAAALSVAPVAALHAPRTATLQSSAAPRLAPLRAYGSRKPRSDEDRFGDDEDWEMEGSGIEYKVDRFGKATPSPFTVGEGYDLKDVLAPELWEEFGLDENGDVKQP